MIHLAEENTSLRPGDPLDYMVGYGDNTVFLHERLYGVRNGEVETIWEVKEEEVHLIGSIGHRSWKPQITSCTTGIGSVERQRNQPVMLNCLLCRMYASTPLHSFGSRILRQNADQGSPEYC